MSHVVLIHCPHCGQPNRVPTVRLEENPRCAKCHLGLSGQGTASRQGPLLGAPLRAILVNIGFLLLTSFIFTTVHLSIFYVVLPILLAIPWFVIRRFAADNAGVFDTGNWKRLVRTTVLAMLLWFPYAVILVPGAIVVLLLDTVIDAGVSSIHQATASKIDNITQMVEVVPSFWEHPMDWWLNRTIQRAVTVEQVREAGSLTNAAFAFLEKLLLLTRWYFYIFLLYLAVRSFGFIWARVAIGQRIGIKLAIR